MKKTDWLEKIAEELHQTWMDLYADREGEKKAADHEHYISWAQLQTLNDGVEAMNQDRFAASLILRGFACGDAKTEEDLPALIHNGYQLWFRLTGEPSKPYHVPYFEAKWSKDKRAIKERTTQAKRVWKILKKIDKRTIENLRECCWIPGRKN